MRLATETQPSMSLITEQLETKIGRRSLLQIGGLATASLFGSSLLAGCGGHDHHNSGSSSSNTELDTLNFALNLEYLEAEFYLRATGLGTGTGGGVPDSQITGLGRQGTVTGGAAVPFTTPNVAQYAKEIAVDELNHVEFLRAAIGTQAVARPTIDFTNTFLTLGNAIGVSNFNPFADETQFLLGAFIFEDVGVTAYHGAAGNLVNNLTYLSAAAGILAVEAYHSGIIRTLIANAGSSAVSLSDSISNARDSFAGTEADQGVGDTSGGNLSGVSTGNSLNLVPTDADSVAFSRTPTQVLNIVYASQTTTPGGFFPQGVNTRTTSSGTAD